MIVERQIAQSPFLQTLDKAAAWATLFRSGKLQAIELEAILIDLGFYDIEFNPVAAKFLNVRYAL